MSVARIYKQNRIFAQPGVVIKNGTGGGAPALNEDAAFPTTAVKLRSRYRFWRSATTPGTPVDLDLDLTVAATIKSVGLGMIRAYRGTAGITSLEVFSASSYPTFTQRLAPQTVTSTDNDLMWDLSSPVSARYWRFRIANAGQFSVKPWLVTSSDVVDLQEGFELKETVRRIRAPEVQTLLGAKIFNDLGVGKAQRLTEWTLRETASSSQKTAVLATFNGRDNPPPMFRDVYGRHMQVTALDPVASWRASGIIITTRVDIGISLVQLP